MTNIRRALQAAAGVEGAPGDYSNMCWGSNNKGQAGQGNYTNYSSPVLVGTKDIWSKVAAGWQWKSAIKTDGTLWTWGGGANGSLGLGNTTNYLSPVQVGALTTWLDCFGGGYGSAGAIKTDGTMWTWGKNTQGQLGLNDTTNRSSPTQVGALTTWSKLSFGYLHTAATKTDGTLWAFGHGYWGALGQGNTTAYSSPVQVGALTTWLDCGAGYHFTVATKTDGTLWACGKNGYGELAQGATTPSRETSPVQVGALTNWSKVACSTNSAMAIKTDGTLWGWGRNQYGELGTGNTTSYSSPVQIGALTNWSKISGSIGFFDSHFVAIKTDGTLWCWGSNAVGALGDGTTTARSSPVQIGALTTWLECGSGYKSGIALEGPPP